MWESGADCHDIQHVFVRVLDRNVDLEGWWRTLKHPWLFLNVLDSVATVRRLVAFYVEAHNTEIPHSAFRGQTPNEIYCGRGRDIPEQLEVAKALARAARLKANREMSYMMCEPPAGAVVETPAAAKA